MISTITPGKSGWHNNVRKYRCHFLFVPDSFLLNRLVFHLFLFSVFCFHCLCFQFGLVCTLTTPLAFSILCFQNLTHKYQTIRHHCPKILFYPFIVTGIKSDVISSTPFSPSGQSGVLYSFARLVSSRERDCD